MLSMTVWSRPIQVSHATVPFWTGAVHSGRQDSTVRTLFNMYAQCRFTRSYVQCQFEKEEC